VVFLNLSKAYEIIKDFTKFKLFKVGSKECLLLVRIKSVIILNKSKYLKSSVKISFWFVELNFIDANWSS
jgi:hypothetical protein